MQFKYLRSLLLIMVILGSQQLFGCDMCGYSVGLNPNYNQNQIGLRYRYRSFLGQHSHSGMGANHAEGSNLENFNTLELSGRWCIGEKWRLQGLMPYVINKSYADDKISEEHFGLGDITLTMMREIWQRADTGSNKFGHRLFAGIGISAPTGGFRVHAIADYVPLSMPGTGAWSGLVLVNYLIRHKNWGLGIDASYRMLSNNPFHYQMAARTNANANLFYQFSKGQISVLPFVGTYLETAGMDKFDSVLQENTGGLATFGNLGFEFYAGNFSLNVQGQIPVIQKLNGSQGQNRTRWTTGIFYSF